jgi:hypothetical protein
MTNDIRNKILNKIASSRSHQEEIIEDFHLNTNKKNQLVAFLKPESFLDKNPKQIGKILDLVFDKLEKYEVKVDGVALFPGPAVKKYSIMDKHYGVINVLSKNASKILTKDERDLVFNTLGIKDKNTKILGGHEAFEISGFDKTYEFDNYWLEAPSTKIKSGFYVRTMKIGGKDTVVVNGFHPQQLAHFTDNDRKLALMLVSSDTPWAKLRVEMLGDTFPDKALPDSIRGTLFAKSKDYGFDKVTIANNVMHLSAGPTEALFEMDNFLNKPFGIDILKEEARLAKDLKEAGLSSEEIKELLTNKEVHGKLEHKDTSEAVSLLTLKAS